MRVDLLATKADLTALENRLSRELRDLTKRMALLLVAHGLCVVAATVALIKLLP